MEDIRELIRRMSAMPHSGARAGAARLLWEKARSNPDPALRFQALSAVQEMALFGGDTDYFLSLIPEMVRLKRGHPGAVNLFVYVWRLKWMVTRLTDFPEIALSGIREAEQVYADALLEAGGSRRTLIYLRWRNACETGETAEAAALREEFPRMPRDSHADCAACEINSLVREAVYLRDWERAVRVVDPLLRGDLSCASVPHATLGLLLIPALARKNRELAAWCHHRGYRLIRSNVSWVDGVGEHLEYLAATGQEDRFLLLLKSHSGWLSRNLNPRKRLEFLTGAAAGLAMVAGNGLRQKPVLLDLPEKWLGAWGRSPLPAGVLAEHFSREARDLAAAFDRRNGNAWRTGDLDRTLAFVRDHREGARRPGPERGETAG